jgi:hypothetical protein
VIKPTYVYFFSFIATFYLHNILIAGDVDLIIFSYNRPLQLEALLYSTKKRIKHIHNIHVLYREKGAAFIDAYQPIIDEYPEIYFHKQELPPSDFKPMLTDIINNSEATYICFAVDDILITEDIDMHLCTQALDKTNAYGFYLRLGTNITYSYNYNISLDVPTLTPVDDDIYMFNFKGNKSYWAYPNTVDMTIYKKELLQHVFASLPFSSPNTLEGNWHRIAELDTTGLCFSHSKMINTPLNIVQEDWYNKNESSYTAEALLDIWQQGLRIDIEDIHKLNNNSAHISYIPIFIRRFHGEKSMHNSNAGDKSASYRKS